MRIRLGIGAALAAGLAAGLTGCGGSSATPATPLPVEPAAHATRPLALVYRGPAGCQGCSEPAARLLRTSAEHFRVRYVGPDERVQLTPSAFAGVALYVQPGGDVSVRRAYRALGAEGRRAITSYVRSGGRYLGICEGAYLAGSGPGMGLLRPGNTGWYIASKGASVTTTADAVIPIRWGAPAHERPVQMYFQDGPYLTASQVPGEQVMATYTNGRIAALVRPFGRGRVGVIGPHPEAPRRWYREAGLHDPDGSDAALGHELITATMG